MPQRRYPHLTTETPGKLTVPPVPFPSSPLKAAGQKITMLTAYDYPTAQLVDAAGIEGILVGDSLSMVVQGHPTTLPVTLEEMIYHAESWAGPSTTPWWWSTCPFPASTSASTRRSRTPAASSRRPAARR